MRFMFSRRWLLFAVVVVLLAYLAYLLGVWQFHRLEDRRADNRVLATNLGSAPVPLTDALAANRGPTHDQEWLPVTASGQWDAARTVVVKYQTSDGEPGVDVVTPLVLADGTAVLVNRGWMLSDNRGSTIPDVPPPADGPVEVTGYVRADAVGRAISVADQETRAVSSVEIGETLPYPVVQGWLELSEQQPPVTGAAAQLVPAATPDDTSEGPHFFYGLQWWFFGALAVFGFAYLAFDERRGGERRAAVRRRRAEAVARRGGRRASRAEEAEQLAAWRYGERSERPTQHH